MPAQKHVHKFRRINIGQVKVVIDHEKNRKRVIENQVWVMKCVKPGCTHYTRMASKLSCPLLVGQIAECHRCEENFILNRRALRFEKPICDNCVEHKGKVAATVQEADKFFEKLMEGLDK